MKTRIAWLVLAIASACHKDEEKKDKVTQAPIAVQTVAVTTRSVPRQLTLTGSLVANQESDLAANATGLVLKTMVERGSVVQQGQVLVQLDLRTAELQRSEALANLETAKQQASLAKQECERAKGLLERGAITQQEFDRTTSQCATTLAGSEAAMARARLAEKTLGDAAIRAPFAGLIGERFVSAGEYVQPQTKVVHLLELDPLRLELTVAEQDIGAIQQGLSVQFNVATFPDRKFDGMIRYVGPAVRAQTRDLVVEAVVPNKAKELRPGMFATAQVKVGEQTLPVIPKNAMRNDETTDRVFVFTSGHLEERIVEHGEVTGDEVAITNGLKGGEQVVVNPTQQMVDGAPATASAAPATQAALSPTEPPARASK
jgi:membrane fusion protein (multidrug efflux system)